MKYLVTGAAGFIGFHVSQRLLAAGHQVVGIDNINDYYDVNLKQARLNQLPSAGFHFVKMELDNNAAMAALYAEEKFDRVIHLAAQPGIPTRSPSQPDWPPQQAVCGNPKSQ